MGIGRDLQRGPQPEQHRGQHGRQHGKAQDRQVKAGLVEAREDIAGNARDGQERPFRQKQTGDRAHRREQYAFGEQLPEDRPRPAPRAVRTAISRSRPEALASSRLATFEQAMSSTQATAP